MTHKKPSFYVKSFTDERLTILAKALLEQCYETDDDLQSEYDSGYAVGCTRFDRQKNCLKHMALSYEWLNITDGSNRLVMNIDGAPFRFTRDDYLAPKKRSSTAVSNSEAIQFSKFTQSSQFGFDFTDASEEADVPNIIKWRFFVDVSEAADSTERDYEIFFVGLDELDNCQCVWSLSEHASTGITSIDDIKPEKVPTKSAKITLPNTAQRRKLSDE